MKRVLFILYEYYPVGSAITNCITPIINKMLLNGVEVDVITRRQYGYLKKEEVINNVKVYRVNDYFNIYNNKIIDGKNKILKLYNKVILKFIWYYRKIKKLDEGFLNIKQTERKIKKIYMNSDYDTIISCSYPFSTHKIAYNIKKNYNITWIAYQFDPHSYNHTLDDCIEEREKEEIKFLSFANRIFLLKENYNENIRKNLKILEPLYYVLPLPLIRKPSIKVKNVYNKKMIFTFAGTLYEGIRTPYIMLEFFRKITFDYELHLFYNTESSIENNIIKYKKEMGDKLILHKNKSKKECDSAIAKCNFAINIGNEMTNQTPSKIFELISYGKPIINFYTNNNDTSKRVLENYPLVLNINKKCNKNNIDSFLDFVKKNKNKILSYEEATVGYETESEVVDKFIREVEKCCEK